VTVAAEDHRGWPGPVVEAGRDPDSRDARWQLKDWHLGERAVERRLRQGRKRRLPVAGVKPDEQLGAGDSSALELCLVIALVDFGRPLGRRPYDLRYAAVSLWLNSEVSATEVARRAGHSVAVLLNIYPHCIDRQADAANKRITDALGTQDT
jgi:hypothetical protein